MSKALGNITIGSTVKLNVNNAAREFIIVHQGKPSAKYNDSCNGTWLLMKDAYDNKVWNKGPNDYDKSEIHAYLNGAFLDLFDTDMKDAIKQVEIPYHDNFTTLITGLSCKIFLLSSQEIGLTIDDDMYVTGDGTKLDYFLSGTGVDAINKRFCYKDGRSIDWWLRSPRIMSSMVFSVSKVGEFGSIPDTMYAYTRPALILPSFLSVSDDGNVTTDTAPGLYVMQNGQWSKARGISTLAPMETVQVTISPVANIVVHYLDQSGNYATSSYGNNATITVIKNSLLYAKSSGGIFSPSVLVNNTNFGSVIKCENSFDISSGVSAQITSV